MVKLIDDRFGSQVARIMPADLDGLRLVPMPVDGTDAEVTLDRLDRAIRDILVESGWIRTSLKDNRILIEPNPTSEAEWASGVYRFHVAPRRERESISKRGLEPSSGGTTIFQRSYPPRIFLAVNLITAFDFIAYVCGDQIPAPLRLANRCRTRDELDIWCLQLQWNVIVFRDVLFPEKGGWIAEPVPPTELKLFESWQEREQQYRTIGRLDILA